jgi:nudix-type nucleoside diphosphatase (YffH/AdpP family)
LKLVYEAYPYLAPRSEAQAQGVVVGGLDLQDLERLKYFEDVEYVLADIQVMTADGPVDASYFKATDKPALMDEEWDFDAWLQNEREIALEETAEMMAHFGIVPVEEIEQIWPGIKIRARMRVRAKSEIPKTGRLRQRREGASLDHISIERPYTRYFAIEEHRLRHKRFDGAWSPEIQRTVLTSGDAATVMPYDPVRDEVLLIEQFRAPVQARGDTCSWVVEVIAGRIDKELSAEDCVRREAREEAGLELGRCVQVSRYYSTPGFAAEHITSFVAEASLGGCGGVFGVAGEDEDIRAFTVPFADAMAAVESGEINTAPAVMSIFWLSLHRERLIEEWTE